MQINFATNWKIEVFPFRLFRFAWSTGTECVWKKRMIAINKSIIFLSFLYFCVVSQEQSCITRRTVKFYYLRKNLLQQAFGCEALSNCVSLPSFLFSNPSTHIKWYFFPPPSCVGKIIAQHKMEGEGKKYKTQWKAIETIKKVLNRMRGRKEAGKKAETGKEWVRVEVTWFNRNPI